MTYLLYLYGGQLAVEPSTIRCTFNPLIPKEHVLNDSDGRGPLIRLRLTRTYFTIPKGYPLTISTEDLYWIWNFMKFNLITVHLYLLFNYCTKYVSSWDPTPSFSFFTFWCLWQPGMNFLGTFLNVVVFTFYTLRG